MELNKIRQGNYLYRINRSNTVHLPDHIPLKVLEIYIGGVFVENTYSKTFTVSNYDLCAIEIQDSLLTQCGFHFTDGIHFQHTKTGVKGIKGAGYYLTNILPEIKYLHQLQNAFPFVSGEELEVKFGL